MKSFSMYVCFAALTLWGAVVGADSVDERIRLLQRRIDDSRLGWTAGRTSMSDLTPSQRTQRLGGGALPLLAPSQTRGGEPAAMRHVDPEAPAVDPSASYFNWADADGDDWTTPVKNQGSCGSCAVFAAVAAVEARANVSIGNPDADFDLSEQHLLSCTPASTCTTGTWDVSALIPTLVNRGIPDEACHPYSESDGRCADACEDAAKRSLRVLSGGWLPSVHAMWDIAREEEIKEALVSGPVIAAFVIPESFYDYVDGVYEDTPPVDAFLNAWHVVAIVGWDDHEADGLPPSWICKNSWGAQWGRHGFFEIRRKSATRMGTQGTVIEVDARDFEQAELEDTEDASDTVDSGSDGDSESDERDTEVFHSDSGGMDGCGCATTGQRRLSPLAAMLRLTQS